MAAFNKFQDFAEQIGLETHQLHTDTLRIYLSNAAPNAATHTAYDGVTGTTGPAEIANGGGYTTGGEDILNTYTESGGTGTCGATDVVWTATAGGFGPFRYVVLYNDTAVGNNLIGWWDYTSSISLLENETFTADFTTSAFTIA